MLNGGAGNDTLTGDIGIDTFVISVDGTGANTLNGSDTITDFDVTAATGDIVRISWQGVVMRHQTSQVQGWHWAQMAVMRF